MNHYCYILFSEKLNIHYIGYNAGVEQRLVYHKNAEVRKVNQNADDWKVILQVNCISKSQGIAIEAHNKRIKQGWSF